MNEMIPQRLHERKPIPSPTAPKRKPYRKLIVAVSCLIAVALVAAPIVYNIRAYEEAVNVRQTTDLTSQMLAPRLVIDERKLRVTAVAIAPDGSAILDCGRPKSASAHSVSDPKFITVRDATTGRFLRRIRGLYGGSAFLSVSSDGRRMLASGGAVPVKGKNPEIVVQWDLATGNVLSTQPEVYPAAYSADGKYIGCATGIYDAASDLQLCKINSQINKRCRPEFTPNGRYIAMITAPNQPPVDAKKQQAKSASIPSPNASRLGLWDVITGKQVVLYSISQVTDFDISRDGTYIYAVSELDDSNGGVFGSSVTCLNIGTGAVIWSHSRSLKAPDNDPNAVVASIAVSPNDKYVVLLGHKGVPIVLDATSGSEAFRASAVADQVNYTFEPGLAFSADGGTLVSRNGTKVLVWDSSRLQ